MLRVRRISERAALAAVALSAISISVFAQPRTDAHRGDSGARHGRASNVAPRQGQGRSGSAPQHQEARGSFAPARGAPQHPVYAQPRGDSRSPRVPAPRFMNAPERGYGSRDYRSRGPWRSGNAAGESSRTFAPAPPPREHWGSPRGDVVNPDWRNSYPTSRYRGHDEHERHFYPARGYVANRLPGPYRVVSHHRENFFFCDGVWYRPFGASFVVVTPPFGVIIPVLPALYVTLWAGGVPYYYANDTYYRWSDSDEGYAVVNPPAVADDDSAASSGDEIYIYPRNQQSEQQQSSDRYACHRWAVTQTGYDPSQPQANDGDTQLAGERINYRRAMHACLDARGYSVT